MPEYSYHHHHHHHHKREMGRTANFVFIAVAVIFLVFILFMVFGSGPFDSRNTAKGNDSISNNRHARMEYDGIDVSHHQGVIDWLIVAQDSSVQFVYIKATEGSTHVDSLYHRNVSEAKLAGLNVGSYHYLTSSSPVEEQFALFAHHAKKSDQRLRPMIDVEQEGVKGWSKTELQHNVEKFAQMVKNHYGVYPVIYSYAKFYNEMLAPTFNSYHLFLAHYSSETPIVKGAGQHNIWQHSDQGIVNGIPTSVDLDVFSDSTKLEDILIK